jgi:hypothetical protein
MRLYLDLLIRSVKFGIDNVFKKVMCLRERNIETVLKIILNIY